MVIISRGIISDIFTVSEEIVKGSYHPLSIIIVGVGKDQGEKFDKMAFLDGETDEKGNLKLFDKKGNRAKRDIV